MMLGADVNYTYPLGVGAELKGDAVVGQPYYCVAFQFRSGP